MDYRHNEVSINSDGDEILYRICTLREYYYEDGGEPVMSIGCSCIGASQYAHTGARLDGFDHMYLFVKSANVYIPIS